MPSGREDGSVNLEQVSVSNEEEMLPEADVIMPEVEAVSFVALGEPTTYEIHYGDEVHQEIFKEIENILTDGLKTDQ